MATSNYGVVAVIQPPMLKFVDQPALIKFETAFSAYRTKVEDVNKDRNEEAKLSMATVKDCIDPDILHALCVMGDIEAAPTLEEATAKKVQAWFDNASSPSPKDLSERIDATIRAVSFKPNKEDPTGGVSNFIITVITSLEQNNASEILKDADMAKKFLDRLVSKVQPDVLQERIKMMRRGWKKEQLASIKLFRDMVSNIALGLSLTETARARVNPRKSKQNHYQSRKRNEPATLKRSSPKKLGASSKSGRNGSKRKDTEWSQPCLNEVCNGSHRLKDCPITPPEKMKEIFERHYANKKSKKAKSLETEQKVNDSEPDCDESRIRVCLEDNVFGTVLGDSGADFSAIDPNVLERIISAVPDLRVTEFQKPLFLEGAFKTDGNVKFTASRSVTLNITIYLPGSNIPVRVRGIEFYVVDHVMGEILLGRPFLHSIGFNLKDQLHRVREEIHDRNLREIDSESLKLSSVKYRGLSYIAADDDPIELPECLAAGIGDETKASIYKAFLKIVSEAKTNGMTKEGLMKLSQLLEQYRDVFRIKLGADPPADVMPITITSTENTKPYRSPQRCYAPQQRDFIIQTIRELEAMGAIYKNPSARWASPALAVPKPSPTKLRFTVNLRGPNSRTVPIQSECLILSPNFRTSLVAPVSPTSTTLTAIGRCRSPRSPKR